MSRKRRRVSLSVLITSLFLLVSTSSFAYYCGDVNCDWEGPDVSDISRLIDFLYLSHDPLCDPLVADVNGSGGEPDMADITHLIDNLYLSHTPLDCIYGTVMDIDGNRYKTVKIGDQRWMAENLKVTRYRNGATIPNVTNDDTWESLTTGARCVYDNDDGNVATYGLLYNWYAVNDSRNIAPEGWHVPTDEEWKQLEMYLGMSRYIANMTDWRGYYDEGGKLKEVGTIHWVSPNNGATDESGFTALPGGYRFWSGGGFHYIGEFANFWTSLEGNSTGAWSRHLVSVYSMINRSVSNKTDGYSIRCVRDD